MSIFCLLFVFDVLNPLMFRAIYCLCLDKKKTFNVLLNDFIGSSLYRAATISQYCLDINQLTRWFTDW